MLYGICGYKVSALGPDDEDIDHNIQMNIDQLLFNYYMDDKLGEIGFL